MAYLEELANSIKRAVSSELVPDEAQVEDLFLLYALLARTKGEQTTAEDVHDAWSVWMLQQGRDHESVKPFGDLDAETRAEDDPYVAAIHAAARTIGR